MNLPSCFNTSSSACFWSVALATWKSGATDKNGTLVICQVSIEHIMMQCLGIIHVCTFTCYCPQPIAGWAYWWRPNVMGWWGRGEVNQKHRKSPNKIHFHWVSLSTCFRAPQGHLGIVLGEVNLENCNSGDIHWWHAVLQDIGQICIAMSVKKPEPMVLSFSLHNGHCSG